MKLWYQITGSGPDLVMLHGWSQNAGVWHAVTSALQNTFRITLIELPGHGASPMVGPTNALDAWVEAVLQVAPQQAAWLGWSLGGLVAQQVALLAPERVQRLCLVATTPCFIQTDGWPHGVAVGDFEQFAEVLYASPEATLRRFFTLQVQGGAHQKTALNQLMLALGERPKANIDGLKSGLHVLLHADLRHQLAQLCMPSAWLWGGKDTIACAKMAHDVAQLLPDSRHKILPRAAHAPFISHFDDSMIWLEQALGG